MSNRVLDGRRVTPGDVRRKDESGQTRSLKPKIEDDTEQKIVDATRSLVAKALGQGRKINDIFMMLENAVSLARGIVAMVRHTKGPSKPKACQAGCTYCCHLQVDVSAPEALRLASYLRDNLSRAEFVDFTLRVKAAEIQARGLNSYERFFARIPCPVLMDGKCSAYEVRPLVCRGYNSFSWVACAQDLQYPRAWKTVPHDPGSIPELENSLDPYRTCLQYEILAWLDV